jgi:hypothetical protein
VCVGRDQLDFGQAAGGQVAEERTPGAHRIGSIDDFRCDAFDTEEELEEFLVFVAESRHGPRVAGGKTSSRETRLDA